ncbi:MAG: nucleotidyltransferase domain-containing protein [Lentisphaeria bacterium]|nr:nucleotidyltransferase domain-containing protein [Lentisphaeria bacterium]
MPVRSLHSSVLRWPEREVVGEALRQWARAVRSQHPDVLRVGYFGSYAAGRAGPGSDLDVVLVVETSPLPFAQRSRAWDLTGLPVPVDLLVYTRDEWESMPPDSRMARVLRDTTVWV